MSEVALVIIAKAPAPGRSKTRLCPPCTPAQAARLAEAALRDTLAAVAATPARRRIIALDGEPGRWLRPGFEVHPQRGEGLAERLANALGAAGGPSLVVGMDTPQLGPALLSSAASRLAGPEVDAILGPAIDGGYWAIGFRRPDPAAFDGVPMSTADTCAAQRRRLDALGLRTATLPPLRDVDTIADAKAVARACPATAFAAAFADVSRGRVPPPGGRGRSRRRSAVPGPTRPGPRIAPAG
jgi:rSAM/selenodomain-associated transferase 1